MVQSGAALSSHTSHEWTDFPRFVKLMCLSRRGHATEVGPSGKFFSLIVPLFNWNQSHFEKIWKTSSLT